MGEEKKTEEKKMEEKKPEEAKEEKKEEPKAEEKKAEEPPPPQEIVLRVYMHCEGCARKVRRCLKGFEGVEDVVTDYKTHKVVVKGAKADPVKVLERVQRKSHSQVELISPIPKPPEPEAPPKAEEKAVPKVEEKKEEVVTVVLKVHMHCEACAQEIKKRMLRMNGVENVEPDLKSSQVTVKGVFDPPKLVDYVYKRTGKHALIVKQEPEKKEEEKGKEEKPPKEEKKPEDDVSGDKEAKKGEAAAKDGDAPVAAAVVVAEGEEETTEVVELKKNEFYSNTPPNYHIYAPPRYEMNAYGYAPQMFSDENPNACSVM